MNRILYHLVPGFPKAGLWGQDQAEEARKIRHVMSCLYEQCRHSEELSLEVFASQSVKKHVT